MNLSLEAIRRAGGKSAKFLLVAIPRSSMAEHSTVNRTVVGSSPTAGALRADFGPLIHRLFSSEWACVCFS